MEVWETHQAPGLVKGLVVPGLPRPMLPCSCPFPDGPAQEVNCDCRRRESVQRLPFYVWGRMYHTLTNT